MAAATAIKEYVFTWEGVDRKGASRGKMTMACTLQQAGAGTSIIVDSDVQLSGSIAQFGRTGLITEIANALVADFVTSAEAAMGARAAPAAGGELERAVNGAPAARPIGGLALLLTVFRGLFKSLFRRTA